MRRRIISIVTIMLVMAALLVPALPVEAQSTVDTSTNAYSVSYNTQENVFFANGRYWVFYCGNSYLNYKTSTNGTTWSSAYNVISSSMNLSHGAESFASCYDGTYFHYARESSGGSIYYRRGTLNSDNTITWSAAEQTVGSGVVQATYGDPPSIAVDSSGHAYISYIYYSGWYPIVTANNQTNGTWATATGFPYTLKSAATGSMKVLALMSNKVYVMYVNGTGSGKILGKLYDSGWSAEQTAVNHTVGVTAWAAVANGDVIEVVSTDGTWRSETRSAAGAWSEADIAASATQNPTLTLLASGDLISSCNSSNHIYRISRTGGAWGSFIDWIDESGDGGLNAERTAVTVHQSNKIGILYKTKTASAYNVKFVYYDTVVAPTVTTEIASGVAISIEKETTGTLNGTLVNMGGAASCDVSFEYGLTTGYGSSTTPVTETGTGPFTASIPIDLIEGTTYHFRAVGVNAGGTGYGGDETFTIPYYSNRFIGLTPFVQVCPLIVLSLFIGGGIVVFIFGVKKRNPLFFVFAFVTISVGMLLYMIIITAVERIL